MYHSNLSICAAEVSSDRVPPESFRQSPVCSGEHFKGCNLQIYARFLIPETEKKEGEMEGGEIAGTEHFAHTDQCIYAQYTYVLYQMEEVCTNPCSTMHTPFLLG